MNISVIDNHVLSPFIHHNNWILFNSQFDSMFVYFMFVQHSTCILRFTQWQGKKKNICTQSSSNNHVTISLLTI